MAFRDARTGLEHLRSVGELRERGLFVRLDAYQGHVFWEFRELRDGSAHQWSRLNGMLGGRGVPSLEEAQLELQLEPVHSALRAAIADPSLATVERLVAALAEATGTAGDRTAVVELVAKRAATTHAAVARDQGSRRGGRAAAVDAAVLAGSPCRRAPTRPPPAAPGTTSFASHRSSRPGSGSAG